MKQPFQTTLLGCVILLIFSPLVVNAETAKMTTSEVKYYHYYYRDLEWYHRFLPSVAPEELRYHTRMVADADINDTPEKEKVVLIVVDTKRHTPYGEWLQAFLLITDTDIDSPKKKDLFKLFDSDSYDLKVPAAKTIELQSPPFIFKERLNDAPWKPHGVSFRLIDLTGDGILDVWVESAYGVALISFQNGEFKEVFSNYTVTKEKLAETSDVEYHYYDAPIEPQGRLYHRFLSAPAPEGLYYDTRMIATANVDDTPENETIALMIAETGRNGPHGEWVQAFLLIAENEVDVLKKKDLFKLFDTGTHDLDVPARVSIDAQRIPPVFREWTHRGSPWSFGGVSFELVDLTGDGILDIWVEQVEGVAVISFQDGEFKGVCSGYSSPRTEDPIEYIDLDDDGIYEIKIPDRISSMSGVPGVVYPEWTSFYEWDGNTYVLNNERFYAENDKFLIDLLNLYNHVLIRYGRFDEYSFCLGLVFYYRGNTTMARKYLQWIANHGEKQHYVHTAEDLLKKLPPY